MYRLNIALSGSIPESDIVSINQKYLTAVWNAGAIPTLLSPNTDEEYIKFVCEHFDGFMFCGGDDLDPKYYGEEKSDRIGNVCAARDEFEEKLFSAAYATGKPILGICRGMQIINVFLGGSLHQHMDGHVQSEEKSVVTHSVLIEKGSMLEKIVGKSEFRVNTFHHQAINSLSPKLRADAYSKDDGYIEACHSDEHNFLLGVQWHPESYCEASEISQKIFKAFIEACRHH